MATARTAAPRMPGTPKPWVNMMMHTLLRVPVLRRLLGRMFAVITVTGAKTGKRYTTPVQYMQVGGEYVVISQRHRKWWKNIKTVPLVELLVQGTVVRGTARVAEGRDAHDLLASCLRSNPRVAKFYAIEPQPDGTLRAADIEALTQKVVVIAMTPGRREPPRPEA